MMTNKRVHYNTTGHAHELTFSCFKKRSFLSNEIACQYLAESLNRARNKYGFYILAYVFMPDHVHILIFPKAETYSISSILKAIKQPVSRRTVLDARRNNSGVLHQYETGLKCKPYRFWQDGGGYDRNIFSAQVLKKAINYIHNNPVRKGLVVSPEQWRWSSYKDWHDETGGLVPVETDNIPFT